MMDDPKKEDERMEEIKALATDLEGISKARYKLNDWEESYERFLAIRFLRQKEKELQNLNNDRV